MHFADVEIHAFHGLDIDRWSFFQGIGLLKNLVYDGNMKFWWKSENKKFEGNLKHFMNDLDAMDLAKFALTNKCKAHIYVEHTMSSADIVEQLDYDRMQKDRKEQDGGGTVSVGSISQLVRVGNVHLEVKVAVTTIWRKTLGEVALM